MSRKLPVPQLPLERHAVLTPGPAVLEVLPVVVRDQFERRHRSRTAVLVDGHEGEKAVVGVPPLSRHGVLGHHVHADLHGRSPDEVDPGPARHELTGVLLI